MQTTVLRLGIAAAFALALTAGAQASSYCPPNGPGAPTYCGNIPHKKAEKKPSPKQQRKHTRVPTKAPPVKELGELSGAL